MVSGNRSDRSGTVQDVEDGFNAHNIDAGKADQGCSLRRNSPPAQPFRVF